MPPTNKYVVKYTNWFWPLNVKISKMEAHYEADINRIRLTRPPQTEFLDNEQHHINTLASSTEKLPKMPDAVA
jgi:hypothetical protein